jgi:hypothetical protein
MIRALLIGCLLLLAACASQPPLPVHTPSLALPLQLHIEREQDGQRQDWLLVIQREGEALRWSLMDPLGIPQARQKLVAGRWQADGLLPPNPQARELFAALLFALTPAAEMPGNYPQAREGDGHCTGTQAALAGDLPRAPDLQREHARPAPELSRHRA